MLLAHANVLSTEHTMDKKAVAFAVADWLNAEAAAASAAGDTDKSETLEMAAVSVSAAYGLEDQGDNLNSVQARFTPLEDVLARGARVTAGAAPPPSAPVDPAVREKAEKIKNEGNELMGKGDTHGAVKKCVCASIACSFSRPGQLHPVINSICILILSKATSFQSLLFEHSIDMCVLDPTQTLTLT